MNLIEAGLALTTRRERARFEAATADPEAAQAAVLARLVGNNRETAFGRDHGFGAIGGVGDFQRAVPIRPYDRLLPYVERMIAGEAGVLVADTVTWFATTSGTAGAPKYVPVTEAWRAELARMTGMWMAYAARDHRGCFDGCALMVASPAVEGHTTSGTPFGAMTGVAYRRIPWLVRRRYAVPYAVSLLVDADERYFAIMRIALARRVTALATPNATTLLRMAEIASARAEQIIRAVHDGGLGLASPRLVELAPATTVAELEAWCAPDPARARALERLVVEHGALRPRDAWPDLRLLGCWLGGSAGHHAGKLAAWYGDTAGRRDLGLLASECRMTVPTDDGTAAGALTVHRSFFELVAEEDVDRADPPVRLVHQAELGKRYNLVITGGNGLWRYDMNDLVEVQGFVGRTPRVAFVRKTRDVLSVTGEKVHVDQVQAAVHAARRATGLDPWQFRLIGEVERVGHALLVELEGETSAAARRAFLAVYDDELARLNAEYDSKRASNRLAAPRLCSMRPGWSERQRQADFRSGKREQQYKWPTLCEAWDAASRDEVVEAIELGADR